MTKKEAIDALERYRKLEPESDMPFNDQEAYDIAIKAIHESSITNEEKIRKMSSWDLANFIHDASSGFKRITVCEDECSKCDKSRGWCVSSIAEWLKLRDDK